MKIRPNPTTLTYASTGYFRLGDVLTGIGVIRRARIVALPSRSTALLVPDGWRWWLWLACDLVDGLAA